MSATAYPLAWPPGFPRSMNAARDAALKEIGS